MRYEGVSHLTMPSQLYVPHLRTVIIMTVLLIVTDEEGKKRKQAVIVSFKSLTQMVANIYSSVGVVISLQTGLTRNGCSTSAKGKKSFSFPTAVVAADPLATRVFYSESKPAGS